MQLAHFLQFVRLHVVRPSRNLNGCLAGSLALATLISCPGEHRADEQPAGGGRGAAALTETDRARAPDTADGVALDGAGGDPAADLKPGREG